MKRILVLGGGPAGYPAALKAASLGAQVILIEKNKLGGVCLNSGCIPSKSLLHDAHKARMIREETGISNIDWKKIQTRQQAVTQKLVQGIGFLLKKAGVAVVEGTGTLLNEHTVRVTRIDGTEQTLEADGIILATGSEAFYPPPFDKIKDQIYDNSNFFTMPTLPQTLAIVGGGVIGCEMADCMNGLGVEVHLIEMQPRLLPLEDENAVRTLTQTFIKRGIKIHTGASATAVEKNENGFSLTLSNGETIQAQTILAAIGRYVNTENLGLENIGVTASRRGISVDPQTLRLKENIYAVGDLNGLCQLAHAATRQGEVAAANLCGVPAFYHNQQVPKAVYTDPEIASVGVPRVQLQEQQIPFKAHKTFLLANGRAVTQEQTAGYYELFSHAQSGILLGAVLVGAQASELVHVVSVALAAKMTVTQLQEVIFAHPTLAEALGEALHR